MKSVVYGKLAIRALRRIPNDVAARIRAKVGEYATSPASQANNVKKLRGMPGYRLRVGDWRVVFDEDDAVIDVVNVGPRGSIYD